VDLPAVLLLTVGLGSVFALTLSVIEGHLERLGLGGAGVAPSPAPAGPDALRVGAHDFASGLGFVEPYREDDPLILSFAVVASDVQVLPVVYRLAGALKVGVRGHASAQLEPLDLL